MGLLSRLFGRRKRVADRGPFKNKKFSKDDDTTYYYGGDPAPVVDASHSTSHSAPSHCDVGHSGGDVGSCDGGAGGH